MEVRRSRPGGRSQAAPNSTAAEYIQSSPDSRHSTPTADERREAQLLAELQNLGYGITIPCQICSHPLTSSRSLALHVGPKCAAKVVH